MQEGIFQTIRFNDGVPIDPVEGRHAELMAKLTAIENLLRYIATDGAQGSLQSK